MCQLYSKCVDAIDSFVLDIVFAVIECKLIQCPNLAQLHEDTFENIRASISFDCLIEFGSIYVFFSPFYSVFAQYSIYRIIIVDNFSVY